jgi:hypothetical protein
MNEILPSENTKGICRVEAERVGPVRVDSPLGGVAAANWRRTQR